MSLVRAVTAGTLAGAVAAFGIYVSLGPDDLGRASLHATPTYPPVPTPTVTQRPPRTESVVGKEAYLSLSGAVSRGIN